MLRYTVLVLFVSCCLADDFNLKSHWGSFKSAFKKKYDNKQQEALKQAHWEGKVKSILKHNLEADMGVHSYKKGINEFTDYTKEEMEQKLFGVRLPENMTALFESSGPQISERSAPDNFDWAEQGVVTKAKSQGSCGSCWAFSVAATIESAVAIKTGNKPVDLSTQHMVDCSGSYGTKGCGGAWPPFAFQYVKENGLSSWNCYPYEKTQKTCRVDSDCKLTTIENYLNIPHNEVDLKESLYNTGPTVVLIKANDNLSAYKSGIYKDDACKGSVNHAVTLVGYGIENGQEFWKVKNSWGDYWGENGFFRMARNYNKMCSIGQIGFYPVV